LIEITLVFRSEEDSRFRFKEEEVEEEEEGLYFDLKTIFYDFCIFICEMAATTTANAKMDVVVMDDKGEEREAKMDVVVVGEKGKETMEELKKYNDDVVDDDEIVDDSTLDPTAVSFIPTLDPTAVSFIPSASPASVDERFVAPVENHLIGYVCMSSEELSSFLE